MLSPKPTSCQRTRTCATTKPGGTSAWLQARRSPTRSPSGPSGDPPSAGRDAAGGTAPPTRAAGAALHRGTGCDPARCRGPRRSASAASPTRSPHTLADETVWVSVKRRRARRHPLRPGGCHRCCATSPRHAQHIGDRRHPLPTPTRGAVGSQAQAAHPAEVEFPATALAVGRPTQTRNTESKMFDCPYMKGFHRSRSYSATCRACCTRRNDGSLDNR